ncbi:aromatic amino acid aminotransferase [Aspergillus eucalypticola CBS 122712]|uniref:Aromatic amino acid aminotransferase n=1 Tax=Aspergillus eucalypticola (strain CBS 122712 / IBT 29274) TaxID=1448314 RepID=A0A317VLR5_ASPEC|nr:aromatic amino acid aminotransferase [Aspergillus eucalypticola CBS 122712]PWY74785.1 aromatic amino acid aminotransferase [Aspergillus eucalypticola CBS 122712]
MVYSTLSPPLDLSHHFSSVTKRREASETKSLYKYFFIPGIANLAGGLPNASYFPYDTLEATVAHPQRFPATPDKDQIKPPSGSPSTERRIVPKESPTTNLLKKIDLTTALQYGTAEGLPVMADFIRQFTRNHLHPNVPYAGGPSTLLTCGATDGFSKAIETFTNPWDPRRDWISQREGILCEEFVYMNAIQTVKPRGLNIVPVAIDAQGMLAHGKGGLADVLENWDFRKGRLPHLMYTITIGQNPTGGTLSVERRREIYALCRQFDIIIIEDDPYWNLQYPSASAMEAGFRGSDAVDVIPRNYNAHGRSSGYDFLDSLVPSYLSVDTDGRVVRLDTFSKTIAPGCRLGWITAQPAVIERLTRLTETSTQQPSGFVQAMVAELIVGQQSEDGQNAAGASKNKSRKSEQAWQMDGWVRWLEGLRAGYEQRMQTMCTILEEGKYLIDSDSAWDDAPQPMADDGSAWEVLDKMQMYEFSWPTGGMFVWVKVCIETHPLLEKYGSERLIQALWLHLMQKPYLCLSGPGTMFAPTQELLGRAQGYYRLCFAAMPAEDVSGITRRLVDGFRAFWQRKNLDGLDDEEVALTFTNFAKMDPALEFLQNTDLAEEIEAINAIYEPDTLTITNTSTSTSTSTGPSTLDLGGSGCSDSSPPSTTIKLQLPEHPHLSFLLGFNSTYPDTPPKILGTASTASRGEGKLAVDVLEDILSRTYQPGAVCLFDLINEAVQAFTELNIGGSATATTNNHDTTSHTQPASEDTTTENDNYQSLTTGSTTPDYHNFNLTSPPAWVLSDVITEKKSVFVGRAAYVTSLDQAKAFLDHLLATEKKVASATHNISAWRIREVKSSTSTAGGSGNKNGEATEMIVQDCDDDGETAAGGRLLHLMQLMDVWDVVVVVTRWYGGVLLGPDRFRIINAAGRDALVKGGFVKEKTSGEKGKKKGKK